MGFKIFKKRRKWYQNNRWHFALDMSLSILILLMLTVLISLMLFNPKINNSGPIFKPSKPDTEEPIIIEDPLTIDLSLNKNLLQENEAVFVYLNLNNDQAEEVNNIRLELVSLSSDFNITNNTYHLEQLAGQESLSLQLSPGISLNNPLNRQLNWNLTAYYNYLQKDFVQDIKILPLLYSSQTEVSARAYYHNLRGDQLGLGPIPPIVGIPTTYYVFFEIENLGNDLNNFVLSANLADRVELTDKFSLLAGTYNYNQDNNRIVWQVNEINKRGGNYQSAFELKITPQLEDLGKNLDLIDKIVYSYQDKLTKQQISASLNKLDNSLPFDIINKNQGIVRE